MVTVTRQDVRPPRTGEGRGGRARPRDIGTKAETAVVRYLQTHGFPHAERRQLRGNHDAGDVTGTPGICWEVKGGDAARQASDGQIADWFAETEAERVNAQADVGVLIVQRAGIGTANAGRWWAILPYVTAYDLRSGDDRLAQPHTWTTVDMPVRLHLADAVTLLRHAGYGDPLTEGEV